MINNLSYQSLPPDTPTKSVSDTSTFYSGAYSQPVSSPFTIDILNQEDDDKYTPDPPSLGFEPMTLLPLDRVPAYLRDSHGIIQRGYRFGGSWQSLTYSFLFQWHNESANAWTMLVAYIVSLAMFAQSMSQAASNPSTTSVDVLLYVCFHLCSIAVVFPSMGRHIYGPMSRNAMTLWRRADMTAIYSVCAAETVIFATAVFQYTAPWVIFTLAAVVGVCSGMGLYRVYRHVGKRHVKKKHSAIMSVMAGLCFMLPLFYYVMFYVCTGRGWNRGCTAVLVSTLSYGLGAYTFAAAVPERWFPKLDLWLNGHSLMHWGVVVGHAMQWVFLQELYRQPLR